MVESKVAIRFSLIHVDDVYWHAWYDCVGIIGMIVLCVAFVCSAKGGCETQPAAHLDNDMKHNILHIFMRSASVKCILCLKMHYLSYKIQPLNLLRKKIL